MKPFIIKVVLDERRVLRRFATKKKRVLFKLGGYVRTTMQRSMRYSKKPAPPGKPPHAHKKTNRGPLLRKLITFFVDLKTESVVCGPQIFAESLVRSRDPLPKLLNEGGIASKLQKGGREVSFQISAHPFTAPVFTDGGKRFKELLEEVPL